MRKSEGQKIPEKEIVKQKFIDAVHSYFASLQMHNSSLSITGDIKRASPFKVLALSKIPL